MQRQFAASVGENGVNRLRRRIKHHRRRGTNEINRAAVVHVLNARGDVAFSIRGEAANARNEVSVDVRSAHLERVGTIKTRQGKIARWSGRRRAAYTPAACPGKRGQRYRAKRHQALHRTPAGWATALPVLFGIVVLTKGIPFFERNVTDCEPF